MRARYFVSVRNATFLGAQRNAPGADTRSARGRWYDEGVADQPVTTTATPVTSDASRSWVEKSTVAEPGVAALAAASCPVTLVPSTASWLTPVSRVTS